MTSPGVIGFFVRNHLPAERQSQKVGFHHRGNRRKEGERFCKMVGFHHRGNRAKGGRTILPKRSRSVPLGLSVLISFACGPGGAALPGRLQFSDRIRMSEFICLPSANR
jgi:hypothetical protein